MWSEIVSDNSTFDVKVGEKDSFRLLRAEHGVVQEVQGKSLPTVQLKH